MMVLKAYINEGMEISNAKSKVLLLKENFQKLSIFVHKREKKDPVGEFLSFEFYLIKFIKTSL